MRIFFFGSHAIAADKEFCSVTTQELNFRTDVLRFELNFPDLDSLPLGGDKMVVPKDIRAFVPNIFSEDFKSQLDPDMKAGVELLILENDRLYADYLEYYFEKNKRLPDRTEDPNLFATQHITEWLSSEVAGKSLVSEKLAAELDRVFPERTRWVIRKQRASESGPILKIWVGVDEERIPGFKVNENPKYKVRMGQKFVDKMWQNFVNDEPIREFSGREKELFKKLVRVVQKLEIDPMDPALKSHQLISSNFSFPVFIAHVENNVPGAMRILWSYGPREGEITIRMIMKHPKSKDAYNSLTIDTD